MVALNNPIGQWHTVQGAESGTVIMEMEGALEPIGPEDFWGVGYWPEGITPIWRWRTSAIGCGMLWSGWSSAE